MGVPKLLTVVAAGIILSAGPLGAQNSVVKPIGPVKWSQYVDVENGWDVPSFAVLDDCQLIIPVVVAADDWLCPDGLPVSDFHWWGSYPMGEPGSILGFELSIHKNIPPTPCCPSRPGDLLWSRIVPTGIADNHTGDAIVVPSNVVLETFYASAPDHDIYQYNLWLAGPEDYFYQEENEIYWLNIIAVTTGMDAIWGWHTAIRPDNGLDAAVSIYDYNAYTGEYSQWGVLHDEAGGVQLAFELTTVPEPASLGMLSLVTVALALRRRFFVWTRR